MPTARRLNVHLVVDGELEKYCRAVNAQLRRRYRSAIAFGDDSPMQPHVTLVMGNLGEGLAEGAVESAVQGVLLSGRWEAVDVRFGEPQIEPTGYVMCSLKSVPEFENLRRAIREALSPRFLRADAQKEEWAHLTLAKLEEPFVGAGAFLTAFNAPPKMRMATVGLSAVGANGSCIERLATWRLDS